ncbi:uncharacterized protein LOC127433384 [Myxocyprinus asiaticus]|uniref:uncharacterized protein LOC127433384 n=1 Tax=Myxocyprinus asiaticus TaxID=70543 RepID=UPI0022217D4B|nr:uncharacterized protein LOC127433384 [Myxocyprinus asiaticus]XP_051541207.1 uncharacterized protein LOC127433384 [Myxocyprinus asiaticus]XP_051541208.1 uncharacterized protein LOC127433384 [Myxocyprinus asiaticus]XP_051541209.1 uncharacterized protein LOC127433384 [Myxocyprinus asiaticus]
MVPLDCDSLPLGDFITNIVMAGLLLSTPAANPLAVDSCTCSAPCSKPSTVSPSRPPTANEPMPAMANEPALQASSVPEPAPALEEFSGWGGHYGSSGLRAPISGDHFLPSLVGPGAFLHRASHGSTFRVSHSCAYGRPEEEKDSYSPDTASAHDHGGRSPITAHDHDHGGQSPVTASALNHGGRSPIITSAHEHGSHFPVAASVPDHGDSALIVFHGSARSSRDASSSGSTHSSRDSSSGFVRSP